MSGWRWRKRAAGEYFCPIEGGEVVVRRFDGSGHNWRAEVHHGGEMVAAAGGLTRGAAAWNAVHLWERPARGRAR